MNSLYNNFDLKCPFCLNPVVDSNLGEKICLKCLTEFEVDDRGECVFVNPDKLILPVNGTVCRACGLVQGEGRGRCEYCGAELYVNMQ